MKHIYIKGLLFLILLSAAGRALGQDCTLKVTVTASNNSVICSGNNITLTATAADGTAPYTYIWSTGETTPTISVNKGGTYTVTVSDQTAGCQPVTKDIAVTESPSPPAPSVASQATCYNTSAILVATAPGGTYQWYDAPIGGNLLFTGDTYHTPALTAAATYYVETTLNGCTGPRTAASVTIIGSPTINVNSICAGNTATLYASNGDNYTWYDAPGGNVLATGQVFITPVLTTNTTYYVVSVVNGCASAAIAATVPVIPYPQPPTTPGNITICAGSSANLHADASGVIEWFDVPNGGIPLITSPDYTTPNLTATTTYYVQNSNGCVSQRVAVTVTVTPIPDAPTAPAATVCAGSTAVLTATSANGTTYNWYADPDGKVLLATANPFTTPAVNANTIYYVQAANGTCTSGLTPVQVTITTAPPAPTASVTPVCQGTPATLNAITPGGVYQWFDAATGGNLLGTGDSFTTPPLMANTTYYVQTTLNGCNSTRTAVTATLLPAATPPTAPGTSICNGTIATLIASGSNNYQWYDAPTDGNLLTAGQVYITPILTATTTYYVETVVNGCTSLRTPVTVTVSPVPQQPVISGATNICPGAKATLTATVPGSGTITWYDVFGNLLHTGTTFTTDTLYENATYYVYNTDGGCVAPRTEVVVSTTPIIYPQFSYSSATYCKSGADPIPLINDPAGGTFSASPAGLVFVSNTSGVINMAASLPGNYTIKFVGNEACQSVTLAYMSIVITPNANFNYAGPYCQYAVTNPSPTFPTGASAGNFTATPTGLVFLDFSSGVIDLKKSLPGTYTITNTIPESGTCPEVSVSKTVLIGPGVTVDAGPDQSIKAGAIAQLAGVITGVSTGTWSGGTGTFSDPTSLNAVYTPGPGEVSAALKLTSAVPPGNCGSKNDVVVITIVPKPTAPTAASKATCIGSSVILSATAPGGTYQWYDAPTGGTLLKTGANFATPALQANATYYVQTTIAGNTSDRTAVTVTINSIPAAPAAAPVSTCYNTTTILTATGSTGSYEWYDAAVGGGLLASGSTFSTPALGSNISYYVQAMSNGCASPRTKVDVTIIKAPIFTSAKQGKVCSGSALNYTITSDETAAVYTWQRAQVAGISNAAVASHTSSVINEVLINTGTTPVTVAYNLTAANTNCTEPMQYIVVVNPFPTVTSPKNNFNVCNDNPINYTITFDDPSADFRWSRAAVNGITNAAVNGQAAGVIKEILHNSTNLPIDVNYVINYSKGECAGSFEFTVTVNPSVFITSAVKAPTCTGDLFTYQITSNVAAATFIWRRQTVPNISNPAVSNQTSSTISETLINTGSNQQDDVYYITPIAYGCAGPEFSLLVTVNPTPPVPDPKSNTPICVGKDIHLQTPTVVGASYLWTGPNGFTSTEQNPQILNATTANTGDYTLVISTNGCPSVARNTNVQVIAPSVAAAGPDQTICVTQNLIKLNGTITGGSATGIWSTSGSGTFSPSSGDLNAQYLPSSQDVAAGSVILTLTSTGKANCNPSADDLTVTFAATPAVDAGANREVCIQDNAIPLSGQLLKPGTATWTSSGTGTFSPSATQLNAVYVPSAADVSNGSVSLKLTFNNASVCDLPSDTMSIKFIPPPTVSAGGTKYVLKGNSIRLQPTVSDDNVTYLWSPNIGIDNVTAKSPVITGDVDRIYTLTVTDVRGCVSQSQTAIKVSPLITVNNTFTPNGDGINDTWMITGLEAYINAEIDVFDRAGGRIYHSVGYARAWDGNYIGRQLPAATYYYVIKLHIDGKVLSGPVTIIR